jgi:hypothetical protein
MFQIGFEIVPLTYVVVVAFAVCLRDSQRFQFNCSESSLKFAIISTNKQKFSNQINKFHFHQVGPLFIYNPLKYPE